VQFCCPPRSIFFSGNRRCLWPSGYNPAITVHGKTVVVTGGANRIGFAVSRHIGAAGDRCGSSIWNLKDKPKRRGARQRRRAQLM